MKLVIDSNRLQSEELRDYLAKAKSNFAVLIDYAAMEAYKGNTLGSIYQSIATLTEFPDQVIVLKGTRAVCGLKGRLAGLQRRLIDEGQSSSFSKYVDHLHQAKAGNRQLQQQLLDHGKEATAHLDRMLRDAENVAAAIDDIARMYSKDERRTIRLGENHSPSFVDKTIKNVLQIASTAFSEHPNVHTRPTYAELPNTYIFRVSLCTYLLALEWGAHGGVKNARPEKLRNDLIDMSFAAYATYFDGLMTDDAKVRRIHQNARVWLMALFGCELPSGLGHRSN